MESVSGLPAHPLFVHAPVVLIPLATLLALAAALRPRLRRQAGWALVGSAAVALITTQLAIWTGDAFDELVAGAADTDDHRSLGLMTRNLVVVFLVSASATALLDRRTSSDSSKWAHRAILASMTLATISAMMATFWVFLTGEEGARLVWEGLLAIPVR